MEIQIPYSGSVSPAVDEWISGLRSPIRTIMTLGTAHSTGAKLVKDRLFPLENGTDM
jgi:hypothetical protein